VTDSTARVQLPKAYLRLDPNVDQTHPDLEGLIRLMCAANRQPQRGRFKSRAIVEIIVGRSRAKAFIERGDLIPQDGGRFYLDSWDEWQEGDMTVGERQKRIRQKRAGAVTPPLPDRDTTVTEPVVERDPPSLVEDVKDVKAKDSLKGVLPAGMDDEPEAPLIQWLAQHKCYVIPGNGYHRQLITGVERLGVQPILTMFDKLSRAGVEDGDTKGFVFGALDALKPKPDLKRVEAEDRERAEREALARRQQRTQDYIASMRPRVD
jgi:hypothetical protein